MQLVHKTMQLPHKICCWCRKTCSWCIKTCTHSPYLAQRAMVKSVRGGGQNNYLIYVLACRGVGQLIIYFHLRAGGMGGGSIPHNVPSSSGPVFGIKMLHHLFWGRHEPLPPPIVAINITSNLQCLKVGNVLRHCVFFLKKTHMF